MKKLFFLLAAVVWLGACGDDYDDSALRGRVDGLEGRVEQLEALCQRMNTNISSLQTLVEALQQNDYVTGVVPVTQGGETVGYTISFTKSDPVTIYHGEQGDKGATPVMGVEEVDGIYYWTVDGEPLTDNDGNRIPASARDGAPGATPQFKIEGGYWHVSYNDGESWQQLGQATGDKGDKGDPGIPGGDSIFANVEETDDAVIFTLADGETTITIPRRQTLSVTFTEGNVLQFDVDETKTVHYTITGGTSENVVKAELQNLDGGYTLRTTPTDATRGTIEIAAAIPTVNRVIVSVSDGTQTIMTAISVSGKEGFDGSTITVATPGTLADLLADYDKTSIVELSIDGILNSDDFRVIKTMINLSDLNLSNVTLSPSDYCLNLSSMKSLNTIVLPRNITVIPSGAFNQCSGLSGDLVLPEGLVSILDIAYASSGYDGKLVLPSTLTRIGSMAFQSCLFSAVYCKATTPPEANSRAFLHITAKTLYVPIGCAAAYEAAENWGDFENIVETDFSDLKNIE